MRKILFVVAPGYKKNSGYKVRVDRLRRVYFKNKILTELICIDSLNSFFKCILYLYTNKYNLIFFENISMVLLSLFNPFVFKKYILDYHGSIYDASSKRFFSIRKIFYLFFEFIAINFYYKIVVVSDAFKNQLVDKLRNKLNSKKIIVIKNIPENYNYLKSVTDVHEFKDGYIKLCYVGNNQSWQRIPQLVRFINKFAKDCSKKIIFNVATAEKSWFNKYLSELNLFFEFNVSYIQNSELYNYLNSQDFLLMLRDEDEINKVACPTKAMEYLLSYTPIITTRNLGDISNYVIKHEKGVVINKPWDSIENINKVNNFLINYKRKPGLFSEIKITDYDNLLKLQKLSL